MGRPATQLSSAGPCCGAKHEQFPLGGEYTWSLPYCSLSEGDQSDLGTCFPRLVLCPQLGSAQPAQASSSAGRGSLTQGGTWLKLIVKQSHVSVTVTDMMVFEECLINASISGKVQQAAGC